MGFPHPIGVLKFLSPAFPIFSWFPHRHGQVGFGRLIGKESRKMQVTGILLWSPISRLTSGGSLLPPG